MKLVTGTLNFLWTLPLILSKDVHVTCYYSEECMLPCQSTYHNIIHWYKGETPMHSFFLGSDQLEYQDKEYKGRTSLLSTSKINEGNVSLLLKPIRIKDEGKYKCYAASNTNNEENFVVVSVVAPVKSVDITIQNDTVTCSTTGVYPEPTVLWSSEPSAKKQLNNVTGETLLVVTSELKLGHIADVYTYNCSMKNEQNKMLHTAILKQQEISVEDKVTLPCPFTKDKSFILIFSPTVLTYNSQTSEQQIHDEWKDKVSFKPEDGTVKLHNLNKEQIGNYTCKTTTSQYMFTFTTQISGNEDTFKCPVTKDQNYNTILYFDTKVMDYNNHTFIKQITDQWMNKITIPSEHSGAVNLSSLNSGTYTCESTTADTRYIIHTKVTLPGGKSHATFAIVIPILFIVVILPFVIFFIVKRQKICSQKKQTEDMCTPTGSEQREPLKNDGERQNNDTNLTSRQES